MCGTRADRLADLPPAAEDEGEAGPGGCTARASLVGPFGRTLGCVMRGSGQLQGHSEEHSWNGKSLGWEDSTCAQVSDWQELGEGQCLHRKSGQSTVQMLPIMHCTSVYSCKSLLKDLSQVSSDGLVRECMCLGRGGKVLAV